MKRIIAAILLLSVAVSLAVWSEKTYEKHMKSFASDIEKLISECGKKDKAEIIGATEEIAKKWHKTDDLLHSLVVHEQMDELEEIIISLPELSEHSDVEEVKTACIEALGIIENLLESEKLSIGNILCINCKFLA